MTTSPVIAVIGEAWPELRAAIERAGGRLGPLADADAVVVGGDGFDSAGPLPDRVRWVQLPGAGVESALSAGMVDVQRVWTSAAGAYAITVAEHAVGLLLAGTRGLVAAAAEHSWHPERIAPRVIGLFGTTVAIVGAGGIGRRVIELLAPFDVSIVALTHGGREVAGASRSLPADRAGEVWPDIDHVVLAAPATAQTHHLIDAAVLAQLRPHSWLVNVGRGSLVDSDALAVAVATGQIAGAAVDVTDPEPLPDDHALWHTPGVLITPHTANPQRHLRAALERRVSDNVSRFAAGRDLIGIIDPDRGY